MPNTSETVRDEALTLLSLDYTQFNTYPDDATFKAWVLTVVDRIISSFSAKAGAAWSLDKPNFFDAAVYETMARLLGRQITQTYANVTQGQEITVGPITIRPPKVSSVVKDWSGVAMDYHRMAMAKLMAEGVGRRKAAFRTFSMGYDPNAIVLDANHPVP